MAQEEDIACIESIAKIVSDLDLESVDYNKDGLHIIVTNRSKEIIAQPVAPAPLPAMPVPAAPAAAIQPEAPAPAAAPPRSARREMGLFSMRKPPLRA